jgi:2-dehydropantoate 2-reductase
VRHLGVTRFLLGEPDGTTSTRITSIANAFAVGGLDTPLSNDIRAEIWLKLLGNTSFNPVSALTRATLVDMADDPLVAELAREMMTESVAILTRLGVTLAATVDERIDRARRVGAHKTSMLQDLEAGRPMEIDALLGSIVELGTRLDIPTRATRHVYALVRLLAKQIGPPALQ